MPDQYEKLYAMLLDASPSSVLLIARDMRVVSANRNFLEKSRRSRSNTIGHRLDEVFPAIIVTNMNIARRVRQVFDQNLPIQGERMTYRAPGIPMRIYYYSILPFSWSGVVESVMLLMEDVTEQERLSEEVHRAERYLASVVESASDMILSTDTEGRILVWNSAAEKISGYSSDEARESFFFEHCVQAHEKDIKKVFLGMRARKRPHMTEWDFVTRKGHIVPVSWVCSPMKNSMGQTVGAVAVGRDLTEHRKLEMQILQSQKLAALGIMAGGIAHEIRNPLAICSSAAQFLMEPDITPQFRRECVEKIYAAVQRASIIIENLLRFARPSAETEMASVNLVTVLRETLLLVANQARIQKVSVSALLPMRAVWVNGISSLLQQVFVNLFMNAITAMPDGGTLTVSLQETRGAAAVRVTDTGHGISPEGISRMFEPFYTTSPVGKGVGLGLSICYSIVKQHLGSIEVDSAAGKGSAFTVKLSTL